MQFKTIMNNEGLQNPSKYVGSGYFRHFDRFVVSVSMFV